MPLCAYYIQALNQHWGREVEGFEADAFDCLLRYDWPGNVRELKHLLEAVFINLESQTIAFPDLPEPFRRRLRALAGLPPGERELLLSALLAANWNKSQAAQQLHWSRMTLYRKLEKFQITVPRERHLERVSIYSRVQSAGPPDPRTRLRRKTARRSDTPIELASWELPDAVWQRIEALIPPPKNQTGRPRTVDLRRITEGILYVLHAGIPWHACPRERFGPPSTVYAYFAQWMKAGVFEPLWAEARALADDR